MTRLTLSLGLMACLALAGCSKPTSEQPEETPGAAGAPDAAILEETVDIGDVEQGVWLQLELAGDAIGGGVAQEKLDDARGKVNLVTVTVTGEPPATLTIDASVVPARDFPRDPVSVKPFITVEAEYGENGEKKTVEIPLAPLVISTQTPTVLITEQVDLMAHLDGVPTTALLLGKAAVVLHPRGTIAADIDPATATSEPQMMSQVTSNPLRINFE